MARVRSFLKLKGSIGETTFREVGGKNYAQDKLCVPDTKRRDNDSFIVTRKNSKEFGSASRAGGLIRSALVDLLPRAADPTMVRSFIKEMMKVMGISHIRWSQEPAPLLTENMSILLGYNFNKIVTLQRVFNTPYTATINRESGELSIHIPSFNPANCILPPKQATHFQIVSTGAEINFADNKDHRKTFRSEVMKLGDNLTDTISITHQLTPASTNVLCIVLGLQFSELTKTYYASDAQAKKVNPLCIVQLDLGTGTI